MSRLPERPHLDHLRKQAKDLLARYRRGEADAMALFRSNLPAAAVRDDAAIAAMNLRLHDAQSCVARSYGFPSWPDLVEFVTIRAATPGGGAPSVGDWLALVYGDDLTGSRRRASAAAAARLLADHPELATGDPWLACAVGDEARLAAEVAADPAWVNRAGGMLDLPPLVAVTHSSLVVLPAFRDRLHAAARLLLAAGADPDQAVGSRSAPASLAAPSQAYPLSALYGAAGANHDPEMTRLLLEAGADPDDNESVYHAVESPACLRLLLAAGATIAGTNAMYRVLDFDRLDSLQLLLDHGGSASEPPSGVPVEQGGSLLSWAIRRRRSAAHVEALLAAGADPHVRGRDGSSPWALALRFGLTEVAAVLRRRGAGGEALSPDERFVAACAADDEGAARRLMSAHPELPGGLSPERLRMLPELAANGADEAVRLMVRLGWPIAARGGDWDASALNHAVFRGDAALTQFLLQHGASWQEEHGFGDNACGTLSWASLNEPEANGDWAGCAAALVAHGLPPVRPDPDDPGGWIVGERRYRFADDVAEVLAATRR